MKPYFTENVHVEASVKELEMLRVALSCWLFHHTDYKKSTQEKKQYYEDMLDLLKDTTNVMLHLPF